MLGQRVNRAAHLAPEPFPRQLRGQKWRTLGITGPRHDTRTIEPAPCPVSDPA